VNLLNESLKYPKLWAKITKSFPGRTQHQIKNRFIKLLAKELKLKREKIREFINKNSLIGPISRALVSLGNQKRSFSINEVFNQQKGQEEEKKEENKEESSFLCEMSFSFEDFINGNERRIEVLSLERDFEMK